jgi:hypothetical protein
MPGGRPVTESVELDPTQRAELEQMAQRRSLPHGLIRRAQIVLLAADGFPNMAIAEVVGASAPLVTHWRRRFLADGRRGLHDAPRAGRPQTQAEDAIARLSQTVLGPPAEVTHWSVRRAAAATGISKTTVHRCLARCQIQSHRMRTSKLSLGPPFLEKVRDIVGLYLRPPGHAVVLCVEEKSQV